MKEAHRRILDYIKSYMAIHNYPPTTREIGDGVGYTSSSTIWGYLRDMRDKGLIDYTNECPRTITIPGCHYVFEKGDALECRTTK